MKTLKGKVALVAGSSRGAGRGIALALGEAGATVYVVGRTTRTGPKPKDGAPGSIEQTAEEVQARGGQGIAVEADFTDPKDVAAVFAQLSRNEKGLDVLVNAVWGGADGFDPNEDMQTSWSKPFWEHPCQQWNYMMDAGPHAYYLASHFAAKKMVEQRQGLIVSITDGVMENVGEGDYMGQLIWDVAHNAINRLMRGIAVETKPHKVAAITLMPGFMRTERVERNLPTEELKKAFRYDLSESTEYVGRAVVALASDKNAISKTGKIHFVADLAKEYGFTDIDGRQVPRFKPFG